MDLLEEAQGAGLNVGEATDSVASVAPVQMEHKELTERIIGCAYRVYNRMGFRFLESVYGKCLLIELRRAGLRAEPQKSINVYYEGEQVGEFLADLLVERAVIVELKSVRTLAAAHGAQLLNYLTATGISVGLLINFGETGVDVRRKVRRISPTKEHLVDNPVNPVDPVDPVKRG